MSDIPWTISTRRMFNSCGTNVFVQNREYVALRKEHLGARFRMTAIGPLPGWQGCIEKLVNFAPESVAALNRNRRREALGTRGRYGPQYAQNRMSIFISRSFAI